MSEDLPNDARRCRSCGGDMTATARRAGSWLRDYAYTCQSCGYESNFESTAGVGYWSVITLVSAGAIGTLLWSMNWTDVFANIVLGGVVIIQLAFLAKMWWRHLAHPVTRRDASAHGSD